MLLLMMTRNARHHIDAIVEGMMASVIAIGQSQTVVSGMILQCRIWKQLVQS